MPDFATHHLFGDALEPPDAATRHPALFRWGLQGPDPLFYRRVLLGRSPYHATGSRMHSEQTAELFAGMVSHCRHIKDPVARERAEAYLYGFAGHYCLDSHTHPYVYARQAEMQAAAPQRAAGTIHSQIENDMDMDIFGYLRHASPCTLKLDSFYKLTPEEKKTVGALYTHLLYEAYQLLLPPGEVIAAFDDTLTIQKLVFSGSRTVLGAAALLDKTAGRGKGCFSCRLKGCQPQWDSLNLAGTAWVNPWTAQEATASVPQLMDRAAEDYQQFALVLERNLGGAAYPLPITLDFSGKAIEASK